MIEGHQKLLRVNVIVLEVGLKLFTVILICCTAHYKYCAHMCLITINIRRCVSVIMATLAAGYVRT